MLNYLQQDAHDHVWGSPRQDNQYLFRLGRLTKEKGINVSYLLNGATINLPDTNSVWHVFNVGHLNPKIINLEPTYGVFKNIIEAMELDNVFVDCFTIDGYQITKTDVYYNYTYEKDLIIAVRNNTNSKIKLSEKDVWFRIYYSALFRSNILSTVTSNIQVFSKVVSSQILLQQAKDYYLTRIVQGGNLFVYKNGFLCNIESISLFDTVEIVHDAAIKEIVEVDYGDLNVFKSEKDYVRKYVLHYPGNVDQLIYYDDVDVYVVGYTGTDFKGLLYSRADVDSFTQLTYKDFSLKTTPVDNIISELGLCDKYKIRLVIRDSGIRREIFDERRRLISMYEMNDKDIKSTLGGFDSNLAMWKPENLENSSFSKFVSTTEGKVQFQDISDLYGYYTGVYRIADSLINTDIGYVYLPEQFSSQLVITEYDSGGLYLGSYNHETGYAYTRNNNAAVTLELLSGIRSYNIVQYTSGTIPIKPEDEYRIFMLVDGSYVDITDNYFQKNKINSQIFYDNRCGINCNYWTRKNNVWQYRGYTTETILPPIVQISNSAITLSSGYDLIVRFRKDVYEFKGTIITDKKIIVAQLDTNIEKVGYGKVELFLNSYSLIRDINYTIIGSLLYIYGTDYIVSGGNKIVLRCYDFPDNANEYIVGVTSSGIMQTGSEFNFFKNREIRMILNGRLSKFDPSLTNLYSDSGPLTNNLLFSLSPYFQDIKNYTKKDNFNLRHIDDFNDGELCDYLSIKKNISGSSNYNLTYKYVSPFLINVIESVLNDNVIATVFSHNYNDYEVVDYCKPFEVFLVIDYKIKTIMKFAITNVSAYTSPLSIDIRTYEFIKRVCSIYFPDQPDIMSDIKLEVF